MAERSNALGAVAQALMRSDPAAGLKLLEGSKELPGYMRMMLLEQVANSSPEEAVAALSKVSPANRDSFWNSEGVFSVWAGKDPHGWDVAARIVAFRCYKRSIRPVWTRDPLNKAGVCRHFDLGIAGGGHTDPTLNIRLWEEFMARVKHEWQRGGSRGVS